MAYEFYVSIRGKKQGEFKGESPRERHQQKIAAIRFQYEVRSPRDLATGQASGKRQHSPIIITKEWGAASPQIFQALVTNELLDSVQFDFIRTNADGEEEIYYRIRLTNANISDLKQYMDDTKHANQYDTRMLEDVSFTFQKIEVEDLPGKTMASDDWSKSAT